MEKKRRLEEVRAALASPPSLLVAGSHAPGPSGPQPGHPQEIRAVWEEGQKREMQTQ